MNRGALGRGLAALLPDAAAGATTPGLMQVPTDQIRTNPYQPRQTFDPESLAELAASVAQHGVVQPITVRPAPDGAGYQIVAGERRWRAAVAAGLPTVPAVVRPCTERELLEVALIENLQREDIGPIEAAQAYRRCLEEFGLTQEQLAETIGKSRAAVANALRLLKLAPSVQDAIAAGRLSEGHGRALLMLADEARQELLARRIERDGLTVRDAEALARELQGRPVRRAPERADDPPDDDPDLAAFRARLERRLGTRCAIRPRRDGGGTVLIEYFTAEDLERIAEALRA